ncbi:PilZ domain-containing protein [Metabacillus sp. KIGAM252]|uniref:PilZ domain-containing protein n=1 Tax=Metabacillus flavus TaxID=2823519 RepID=A0ABS5LD27_9BACI|nr:PilZ domain-containing protein [Metabacillus flavus]MBS2968606.1 PilZ domain-containing protein [Metabacillus flavus]
MRYNRSESFRFVFSDPIQATFSIVEKAGEEINTKPGDAVIMDISPSGLKLISHLELPMEEPIILNIAFRIRDEELELKGEPMWKKPTGSGYQYGIRSLNDQILKNRIVKELKEYAQSKPKN